jgi:hypothetical protein
MSFLEKKKKGAEGGEFKFSGEVCPSLREGSVVGVAAAV